MRVRSSQYDNTSTLLVAQLQYYGLNNSVNRLKRMIYQKYIEPSGLLDHEVAEDEELIKIIKMSEEYNKLVSIYPFVKVAQKRIVDESEFWANYHKDEFIESFFRWIRKNPKMRNAFVKFLVNTNVSAAGENARIHFNV